MKKTAEKEMTDSEQRSVLEAIARDEDAYPRDRISAVKALQDMSKRAGEDLDAEFERLMK